MPSSPKFTLDSNDAWAPGFFTEENKQVLFERIDEQARSFYREKALADDGFVAAHGDIVRADTTGGAFSVSLPAAPTANDTVVIADKFGTFATNNLTVGRNGRHIKGVAEDLILDVSGISVTFVYSGGSLGWSYTVEQGSVGYLTVDQYARDEAARGISVANGASEDAGAAQQMAMEAKNGFAPYDAGNITGNTTFNFFNGSRQEATLTGNVTILAPTNGAKGNELRLYLKPTGANRTLSLADTISIPSDSAISITSPNSKELTQNLVYVLMLRRGANKWHLLSIVGGMGD